MKSDVAVKGLVSIIYLSAATLQANCDLVLSTYLDSVEYKLVAAELMTAYRNIENEPFGRDAWTKYKNLIFSDEQKETVKHPLRGLLPVFITGEAIPAEYRAWLGLMDQAMADRDDWVRWNIWMAQRIRTHQRVSGSSMYEAMKATLKEEANDRGLGEEILILDKRDGYDAPTWRKMIAQGRLFIDSKFCDAARAGKEMHTEIVHLLQILYLSRHFEAEGYPRGHMKRVMQELLGNNELINKILWMNERGNFADGNTSPWYDIFDASREMAYYPQRPEWFGEISHIFASDIPYEQFSQHESPNYHPTLSKLK